MSWERATNAIGRALEALDGYEREAFTRAVASMLDILEAGVDRGDLPDAAITEYADWLESVAEIGFIKAGPYWTAALAGRNA